MSLDLDHGLPYGLHTSRVAYGSEEACHFADTSMAAVCYRPISPRRARGGARPVQHFRAACGTADPAAGFAQLLRDERGGCVEVDDRRLSTGAICSSES